MKAIRGFVGCAVLLLLLHGSTLCLPPRLLEIAPYRSTGIYGRHDIVGWKIVPRKLGDAQPGTYDYKIVKNGHAVLQEGRLDFSFGQAKLETLVDEPAMVTATISGQSSTEAYEVGAAVDPIEITPSSVKPDDFDEFWAMKLGKLREIPINPSLTAVASDSRVELYKFQLDSLGSHVRGYLAKPKGKDALPALVMFQYAGVYALQPASAVERARAGWLVIDVDAHDKDPQSSSGIPTNYPSIGNADREASYFLQMYLRDSRAIDFAKSRGDWDGKTIVVVGTSMGGQQALATAALNTDSVTAVIVNEPAGADSGAGYHEREFAYPFWPSENPAVRMTAAYFDVANFAPLIKAPTVVGVGFVDKTCPATSIWSAFNRLKGDKEAVVMVGANHTDPKTYRAFGVRQNEILGNILKSGSFDLHPGGY